MSLDDYIQHEDQLKSRLKSEMYYTTPRLRKQAVAMLEKVIKEIEDEEGQGDIPVGR